jgi:hypothetical protein
MRGKSHDVANRSRTSPFAASLILMSIFVVQGLGAANAKSAHQCEADSKRANRLCNAGPADQDSTCYQVAYNRWKRCMCEGGYKAYCYGGASDHPYSLSPDRPPRIVKPEGAGPVGTPPKSSTPGKPQGPGSVGTPPKSNPMTGVKPQGPGSVGMPPKSSSPSGGGPILRSGNSGNSNSGGGNSGGSKR